jgi:type II secretory pathway pseudopilin PulG
MKKEKLISLLLRVSIASSLLYAALAAFLEPTSWVGFLPSFIRSLPIEDIFLLNGFGAIEVIIALWIFLGKRIFIPSAAAAVLLLSIVIFNFSQINILFRDFSLALAALALTALSSDNKTSAPHNGPNYQPTEKSGFALIELLVETAIIALLSSAVFASLNSARAKAKATRILEDFKTIEKALYLLADKQDIDPWWLETDYGLGSNPFLTDIVADQSNGLYEFLPTAPLPPTGRNSHYEHDNNNDAYACDATSLTARYGGENLFLRAVDPVYFPIIDQIVDGGDGAECGRITESLMDPALASNLGFPGNSVLTYRISVSGTDY